MSDDNIVQFPVKTDSTELEMWFSSIGYRVGSTPVEDGIVVLVNTEGEEIVYVMNDMRKDAFAGLLQIAMLKGLYDSVAQ